MEAGYANDHCSEPCGTCQVAISCRLVRAELLRAHSPLSQTDQQNTESREAGHQKAETVSQARQLRTAHAQGLIVIAVVIVHRPSDKLTQVCIQKLQGELPAHVQASKGVRVWTRVLQHEIHAVSRDRLVRQLGGILRLSCGMSCSAE
jgi:hypothetical protein